MQSSQLRKELQLAACLVPTPGQQGVPSGYLEALCARFASEGLADMLVPAGEAAGLLLRLRCGGRPLTAAAHRSLGHRQAAAGHLAPGRLCATPVSAAQDLQHTSGGSGADGQLCLAARPCQRT